MNIKDNNLVVFYGPIGSKSGNVIGGGESGNLKTISLLEKLGYTVIKLPKPYPNTSLVIFKFFFPFKLFFSYLKFLIILVLRSGKFIFHLSGFYNHLIYVEFLYIYTCKLFKIPCVYELRAGGAIDSYLTHGFLYKFFFRSVLKTSTKVLCQGQEYIPFIKKIADVEGLYYPNFIQDEFLIDYNLYSRNMSSPLNIVYFGRIAPSKNIEFIIEVCEKLQCERFTCEIIGDGLASYKNKINSLIHEKGLSDKVFVLESLKGELLFNRLNTKHFFLFPSKEKREGHSNSLTEAMSRGVVPIASKAGFNSSVIKNEFLTIETFDPNQYSNRILTIWNSQTWSEISSTCYQTVKNNFTEAAVKDVLLS